MESTYIVTVQCEIAKENCPGFYCESAFVKRTGAFREYPDNANFRNLTLTCGGCCGRSIHRKLSKLIKTLKKAEDIDKNQIIVHLSSCMVFDNYHSTPCPHIDYIKNLIENKLGLPIKNGTKISSLSAKRREEGQYESIIS